ncbi:probable cytochrome P450 6a13 [Epargyreus clarus]|uniref:probable cytochrome P450 6a13 n=1 Tax=Epargyreus clarus TaxID=520877 RepID=UPI003C2C39C9
MSVIIATVQFLTKELIVLTFSFVLLVYLWFQYKFTYWSKRGVIGPAPVFPFGNIRDVIKRKKQFFQPCNDNYIKYKHLPYVGMYSFSQPVLVINDPEIAKLVLIKDFNYFSSHGLFSGGVGDPLAGHLFNLQGKAWTTLRYKLSPAFSTAKLKAMYPLVNNIANEGLAYAERLHARDKVLNFSDFNAKYSMEIIGSVGYGMECNGFKNEDSDFYVYGKKYFEPKSLYWTVVRGLAFFVPTFFNKLRINRINPEIISFFYNLVRETVEYRAKHNYERNDFLQTLIELKNGKLINDQAELNDAKDFTFTMTDIASNTLLYMLAGYETSATTGQYAAYELARNPHIQAKAREEVLRVFAKHGQWTYEAQHEVVYLNMIIDETLRMYPPLRALFRRCTKDYKLPNSDLVIEEGTLVFMPIAAIQMDPEIFPKPEVFDPERFSPENKAKIHQCHWMPFGEGPKKCLGIRQGYIQTKMALIKILQKYELLMDERTAVPFKLKATSLVNAPDSPIWLKLRKL